jgi:putative transposase
VNRLDDAPGRKVWHQYWDTHITHLSSFFARLRYVHTNPVKHGLVRNAEAYEFCSAAWFARTVSGSFRETIMKFPSEQIVIADDYEVSPLLGCSGGSRAAAERWEIGPRCGKSGS